MKKNFPTILIIGFLSMFSSRLYTQTLRKPEDLYTAHNKGKFFVYWGWNRGHYSKSDIHFQGDDYDFTIHDARAHDKPLKVSYHDYLQPDRITIPQTNVRVGYFISDHYNISLGIDHMKYVMTSGQTASVSGYIDVDGPQGVLYNGNYSHSPTQIDDDFVHLEHTDGLNYVNIEFSRYDDLGKLLGWVWNTDIIQVNLTEGIGVGALVPKTNATILNRKRHDKFHLSGFGISGKGGINLTFLKYFFIQGDIKGGYIDMPDIRTTYSKSDKASQHFFFVENSIILGGIFKF